MRGSLWRPGSQCWARHSRKGPAGHSGLEMLPCVHVFEKAPFLRKQEILSPASRAQHCNRCQAWAFRCTRSNQASRKVSAHIQLGPGQALSLAERTGQVGDCSPPVGLPPTGCPCLEHCCGSEGDPRCSHSQEPRGCLRVKIQQHHPLDHEKKGKKDRSITVTPFWPERESKSKALATQPNCGNQASKRERCPRPAHPLCSSASW